MPTLINLAGDEGGNRQAEIIMHNCRPSLTNIAGLRGPGSGNMNEMECCVSPGPSPARCRWKFIKLVVETGTGLAQLLGHENLQIEESDMVNFIAFLIFWWFCWYLCIDSSCGMPGKTAIENLSSTLRRRGRSYDCCACLLFESCDSM